MPEKLSEHFTLQELCASEVAMRHGLSNVPDAEHVENLRFLAQQLEDVRDFLGFPIHVNSAYRSLPVNALVGSKPTSAHVQGLAADFVCPGFGRPRDIVIAITGSDIQYDQLILEYDSWVHIGFRRGYNRLQKLSINSKGTTPFIA